MGPARLADLSRRCAAVRSGGRCLGGDDARGPDEFAMVPRRHRKLFPGLAVCGAVRAGRADVVVQGGEGAGEKAAQTCGLAFGVLAGAVLGADCPDSGAGRLRSPGLAHAGAGGRQRTCLRRGGGVWQGAKRMGAGSGAVRFGLAETSAAAQAAGRHNGIWKERPTERTKEQSALGKVIRMNADLLGAAYVRGYAQRVGMPSLPKPLARKPLGELTEDEAKQLRPRQRGGAGDVPLQISRGLAAGSQGARLFARRLAGKPAGRGQRARGVPFSISLCVPSYAGRLHGCVGWPRGVSGRYPAGRHGRADGLAHGHLPPYAAREVF